MPRFEPFRGLRYDPEVVDIGAVTAPPYDVIDDAEREELAARSPYNVVHVDLPVGGEDRYDQAARRFQSWRDEGVVVEDDEPSFYVYRMGFRDEAGRMRQTSGVLGSLALSKPGEGGILPHEHTTPKAKSDRLRLLRATDVNLSPIWGLSLADGLSALCEPPGPPDARCTDDLGVHHRLWRITAPALLEAIATAVDSTPVVIADGHHRYETSLAYRDERHQAGAGAGPWDAVLTLVVELADDQLAVGPIHRVVSGLPDGFDLRAALEPYFDVFDTDPPDATIAGRMADAGALALVTTSGTSLLRPRPEAMAGARDLDSSRLDVALGGLPPHELAFQHGVDNVARLVQSGAVQAGILLRPASVAQIAATAHGGDRMPPKTTYFWPKPRTGLLFRSISS